MRGLGVPVAAAIMVAASTANVAAQAQEACWANSELQAARVHDLQTMLMIGSLQCSETSADPAVSSYNEFVRRTRDQLRDYNNVLKARFMRLHGVREGQRAYDTFNTGMANDHSSRARSKNFCATVVSLSQTATAASQDDLEAMAQNISDRPYGVGDVCTETAEAATPVAAAAAVTPAAETEVAAVAPPAVSAAPVSDTTPAATATGGMSAQQHSAAEALKAAALAVQAAAAALQTSGGAAAPAAQPVAANAPAEPIASRAE